MQHTFHYCEILLILTSSFLTQALHAKNNHHDFRHDQELISNKKLRIGFPKPYMGYGEFLHMERNNVTNDTILTGYCIDVFLAAIRGLPYELDYEFIPFADENGNNAGTYNDLVYQIYLQNFDAVIGDVTITANRSQYAEFTLPYTDVGVGTIAKRVEQNDLWIFLRPFNNNLWFTSLVFFIFTGFVVWFFEHRTNDDFGGSPSQQIGTVFWFALSTLVFAHREKLTSNLSKFVVVVWMFAVLILTSSYTATLTSLLTVQQIQLTTLSSYVGYRDGLYLKNVINNMNFENHKLRAYRTAEEYANALSRGSKNGGADAIIDEIPYLKLFLAKYPDDYTLVKSTPITNGFGFAFAKGSPLVSDVSREIARLRESRELMKMEEKWLKYKSTLVNQPNSVTNDPKTLDFYSFRGLFLITSLSSTLTLAIFLFRKLYKYCVKLVTNYFYTSLGGGGEILPVYIGHA